MKAVGDNDHEKISSSTSTLSEIPIRKLMQGRRMKILTDKQMLQRLPIALEQVKTGNTSGNLLNEILQIIYFLH